MKTILITGATGLLGSWIAKDLAEQGFRIRAQKRASSQIPALLKGSANIELVDGDILDPLQMEKLLEGVDIVIHSAAVVSFRPSERKKMYEANILGTEILVDLALDKGIDYFLHISSVAAVGRSIQTRLMNEETPWEDNALTSHYSRTKFLAEKEVWRAFSEGLRGSIINPSVILGPAPWERSSAKLLGYVWKKRKFFPGGSLNVVDVRDVSLAIKILLEKNIHGQRFILNSGKIDYASFFRDVAKRFNVPAPSIQLNKGVLKAARIPENILTKIIGKDPLLTREMINNSFSSHEFSAEKFKKSFGFTFIPIDESIEWACRKMMELNVDK